MLRIIAQSPSEKLRLPASELAALSQTGSITKKTWVRDYYDPRKCCWASTELIKAVIEEIPDRFDYFLTLRFNLETGLPELISAIWAEGYEATRIQGIATPFGTPLVPMYDSLGRELIPEIRVDSFASLEEGCDLVERIEFLPQGWPILNPPKR